MQWTVTVEGHASSEGPPEPYNQKLSERRAEAVVSYLKDAGVPAEHLKSEGHSYRDPVADNSTLSGRVANRRAELVLNFTVVRKFLAKGEK